jgi:hypothetical protein
MATTAYGTRAGIESMVATRTGRTNASLRVRSLVFALAVLVVLAPGASGTHGEPVGSQ